MSIRCEIHTQGVGLGWSVMTFNYIGSDEDQNKSKLFGD